MNSEIGELHEILNVVPARKFARFIHNVQCACTDIRGTHKVTYVKRSTFFCIVN